MWLEYSQGFIRKMAQKGKPWFLYHCTRGCHFDNYPSEDFVARSPARHPYTDCIAEMDHIFGSLMQTLEDTGQLENTLVILTSDNGPELETWPDSARTPFRLGKGSTWEGGRRSVRFRGHLADAADHGRTTGSGPQGPFY
jgi:arylsulfatase A-like enzyme